uniref:Defensin-like protein n=1 Tax=Datisca glomerata TaxID=34297 RepID=H6SWQ0_DATGL|nr:defensin-like protein [Datisca glomerata]
MANIPKYISLFSIFITLLLLLNEATALCGRKSETFQGHCMISFRCNHRCRRWENAARGVCQRSFGLTKECHCYFDECSQTSTMKEGYGSKTPTYEEGTMTTTYEQNHNRDTETPVFEEAHI